MFAKLFAESGLSLDRLKALLEVAATGSLVKAAHEDPVRQSQYSRQIKELEDFFRIKLVERHGKGIRLTTQGRELARISRFFMLGLSNFQQGCRLEEQTFRLGASATYNHQFLIPALATLPRKKGASLYAVEITAEEDIQRRLHDLTLDFGIVTTQSISRPLQTSPLNTSKLQLWVPKALGLGPKGAKKAFQECQLPIVIGQGELAESLKFLTEKIEPNLTCHSFLEARAALDTQSMAAVLPDFLAPALNSKKYFELPIPSASVTFQYCLAWNPRLLRLNPHAIKIRDHLLNLLTSPPLHQP